MFKKLLNYVTKNNALKPACFNSKKKPRYIQKKILIK